MSSLVPEAEGDLHFVLCDFGARGKAFLETDPSAAVKGRNMPITAKHNDCIAPECSGIDWLPAQP
jgi:hypothetical protein